MDNFTFPFVPFTGSSVIALTEC